ncbi:MAG: sensor histidine kinase [Blastocatellia bacterium]
MSNNTEDALLIEAGRLTARLIHDFKNQIGGMKLYASYLKKRFSDQPEGVEIAEKIIQGLNEMAEQAALIGKLTRPIEIRRGAGDLDACIEMVLGGLKSLADSRRITLLVDRAPVAAGISIDLQQMQAALSTIIARAIEASPEQGEVKVALKSGDDAVLIEVADQGETPDEEKLRAIFDALTNERINRISLGLALARRIVLLHGGEVSARAGAPAGTVIEVRLKKENSR